MFGRFNAVKREQQVCVLTGMPKLDVTPTAQPSHFGGTDSGQIVPARLQTHA